MAPKDMLSSSDIVENDTGENPVKYTEKHKFQYPLNVQVFGPFRSRMCLLYDKIRDNATVLM